MSTFGGIIEEIPMISVDRFNGENLNSTVYFLSHCHQDHMVGLSDNKFRKALINTNRFLYASAISVNILKYKFPHTQDAFKILPIGTPTLITFPDSSRTLSVTPLPAGHCPGSVMFLFESDKNILYTGDYRVQLSDLKKYRAFYSLGQLKQIHKMYLDTTFFTPAFNTLPLRHETIHVICDAIKKWISQSQNHIVQLVPSATYGSEYLFSEISKSIGMPLHVSDNVYNLYKCIPELEGCVTLDNKDTQIHVACGATWQIICQEDGEQLTIKPSTLYWKGKDFKGGISVQRDRYLNVCYSCHASYEEIREFLMFLKPLEIEPCVEAHYLPNLRNNINKIVESYKQSDTAIVKKVEDGRDQIQEKLSNLRCVTPENPPENLNMLDSPPKSFKRKRSWLS